MSKEDLSIVKIGGNIIEDPLVLQSLLHRFANLDGNKILVHGGGKKATEMESRLGISSERYQGRRITGGESLEVMIMVYAGLVNKRIVASLQSKNCNAIGLSGADGASILARKRPVGKVDFGYVGDIEKVNSDAISKMVFGGFTPVFCALTYDSAGQLYNTNADTIASELAIAMSFNYKTKLYYCFEKKGVLRDINDEDSVIGHIDGLAYKNLLEQNMISDGMLPKLHTCFRALRSEVSEVYIGNETMLDDKAGNFTRITL